MLRIGITGQAGFVGTHLYRWLSLKKDEFQLVESRDEFFEQENRLDQFVSGCDAIVHLAAMNRHSDPQVIYDTNIRLVSQLISALERTGSRPHVLFSSSTQEELENIYGKSKQEGRKLLAQWAQRNQACFTGLIIPNVFGPFGKPYYNSVVATFCHQLTHHEEPKIMVDGTPRLIFVGRLVQEIEAAIVNKVSHASYPISHQVEMKVSEILDILKSYAGNYLEHGIFPALKSSFEIDLFNTFRSYIDNSTHFPVGLKLNADERGQFVETIRSGGGGQFSFSTTVPGVTRGNHFHTRKIERFIVIDGQARIDLRKIGTEEVISFDLDGRQPAYVDMPVWYTHNITNTGRKDLVCLFWINEFYDPADPDTYFEPVTI